jgi:hypothetical protein
VDSINRGDIGSAKNQLGAFINHVNALVLGGILTTEQASPVITAAQALIQNISTL